MFWPDEPQSTGRERSPCSDPDGSATIFIAALVLSSCIYDARPTGLLLQQEVTIALERRRRSSMA